MSTMDFFAHQDRARKLTRWLVFYYVLAVLLVLIALNLIFIGVFETIVIPAYVDEDAIQQGRDVALLAQVIAWVTGIATLVIVGGTGVRLSQVSSMTGGQVAESFGGRQILPGTTNFQEKQLLNIIEEMSIAAGIAVPQVFVLEGEESLNAFAAGWSENEAAVAVTQGSLNYLNRDELQGLIAHEFSHILNGDMKLDMRLVGVVFGLELIFLIGWFIFRIILNGSSLRVSNDDDNKKGGGGIIVILLIALAVAVIGLIGKTAADIIRAAISRQKEYLADASAVQFTRNPEGIGYTLIKIGVLNNDIPLQSANAAACGHFFFTSIFKSNFWTHLWDSHPPLDKRIQRILPGYNGEIPQRVREEISNPPGLRVDNQSSAEETNPKSASARRRFVRGLALGTLTGGEQIPPEAAFVKQGVSSESPKPASLLQSAGIKARSALTEQQYALIDSNLRDIYGVQTIFYALLLDSSEEIRKIQIRLLQQNAPDNLIRETLRRVELVSQLPPEEKIVTAELGIPAIKLMSVNQYNVFKKNIAALTEADKKIDLFEFSLRMMIIGRLDSYFNVNKPYKIISQFNEIANEFAAALGYIAWQGAENSEEAIQAYAAAINAVNLNIPIPEQKACSLSSFAAALKKLQHANSTIKNQLITALSCCVNYDGKITPREKELIFSIKASLNI